MLTEPIFVLGAGGHAKVVVDALRESGIDASRIRVRDDSRERAGPWLDGFLVETPILHIATADGLFHLAIGNALVRQRLFAELSTMGAHAYTVTHPAAIVSRRSDIGAGCFIAARAIVAPAASLGASVIVNHGAIVDHDCQIGDFSHIAPNATLAGEVHVGNRVLIGAGANILPGIRIGDDAIIGAGAVVTRDVRSGQTVTGVPARPLEGK